MNITVCVSRTCVGHTRMCNAHTCVTYTCVCVTCMYTHIHTQGRVGACIRIYRWFTHKCL